MAQGRLGDKNIWEGGQDGAIGVVLILSALDRLSMVVCVRVYAHDVISESFFIIFNMGVCVCVCVFISLIRTVESSFEGDDSENIANAVHCALFWHKTMSIWKKKRFPPSFDTV